MIENIEQGSDEWKQARCGLITGSKMSEVMQEKKGTGHANYRAQLVAERMTGVVTETFKNAYMERGNEDEQAARDCYSFVTGMTVEQVGLVKHPTIECFAVSPDGLCGEDGLVEFKRKIPALHIDYILKDKVPAEYIKQMTAQLSCSGRKWVDFCSYCPEMPEEDQLFIIRFYRDDAMIKEMEAAVIEFNLSIEDMIAKVIAKRKQA